MKSLLVVISLFCFKLLHAQSYNYQHYDVSNGLSGLTVYKIIQDREGFMWFATETGLSRFDGTNFKNFSTADGLPDNEIIDLSIDSKGRMWILPFTNAICYYKDGLFHNQKNDSLLARISLISEPTNIAEGENGELIILDRRQIVIVTPEKKLRIINRLENHLISPYGAVLVENNTISVPVAYGVEHAKFSFLNISEDSFYLSPPEDARQYIWTTSLTSLLKPSLKIFQVGKFLKILQKGKKSYVTVPDNMLGFDLLNDSMLFVNCSDKVLLYNFYQHQYTDTFLLNKVVTNSFLDSEGSYWFATNGYGVYRLASTAFVNYNFVVGGNLLPVYSIAKSNQKLYVGTNRGKVWDINLINNSISANVEVSSPGENRITGIAFYDAKTIVASSSLESLCIFENGKKTRLIKGASGKDLYYDKDQILISTIVGVYKLKFGETISDPAFLTTRTTCSIFFQNDYFIGTLKGLFRTKETNIKDSIFLGEKFPLLTSRISALAKTNHSIWVATYGNGIIEFDGEKILSHYTQANGLSSNMCRDIFVSGGKLWVGTDKGLNEIDLTLNKISNKYTTKDGLSSDIINCIYVENDSVFVGTPYGLTFFSPNAIDKKSIAVLNVNKIASKDSVWLAYADSFTLKPSDNKFYIDYACVSFKSNGNIHYYYRLVGLDNEWHNTKETSINYPSLPPGNYQFQLYAVNAFGKKSNEVKISFSIESFFYQKAWFLTIVCILGILIVWYFVSRRIKKIRAEQNDKLRTQKRLTELEQLAFRAQMNPHFIFNCLNSIQQYIFSKSALEANKFITDFSSLIRQTLDLSAKKNISLAEEIRYISTYLSLEHTRFDKSFDYSINIDGNLNTEEIFLPPLLMQPFVENAIRHGIRNLNNREGVINIDFSLAGDYLVYQLTDNGIGIEGSLKLRGKNVIEHQSKGMTLIQKRIEALNEESSKSIEMTIDYLDISQKKETKVILRLPVYI